MGLRTQLDILNDFEQKADLATFYEIYGMEGERYWDIFIKTTVWGFIQEISSEAEEKLSNYLERKHKEKYEVYSLSMEELIGVNLQPLEKLIEGNVMEYVHDKMKLENASKMDVTYEVRILITAKKKS